MDSDLASEMLQWCNILEVAIDALLLFGFSLISLSCFHSLSSMLQIQTEEGSTLN